jgi:simple sugar transport system substrate-binding protein
MLRLVPVLLVICVGLGSVVAVDTNKKTFTIATINKMDGIPWFDRSAEGIKAFSEAHPNVKAFIQGPPKVDAALQTQMIEDIIAQKVDAICVTPFQPEPLEPVLKKAMDRNIVVITQEASNAKNVYYDIEAFDNASYGRHLMDAMAKRMGGKGEYAVFVASLTSKTHNEWVDSAIAYQKQKYPNMKLVGTKNESYDDPQKAYEKMKEVLTKYPNIKGVQGSSAYDVVGIGQAVEEAGLQNKIMVVGTSLPSMVGMLIESGAVKMASVWDPALAARVESEIALMILEGKQSKIKNGLNLGIPGYNNIKVVGKVIYGQAWLDFTKENYKNYKF